MPWVLPVDVDAVGSRVGHHGGHLARPACPRAGVARRLLEAARVSPSANGDHDLRLMREVLPDALDRGEEGPVGGRLVGVEDVGWHEGEDDVCDAGSEARVAGYHIVLSAGRCVSGSNGGGM